VSSSDPGMTESMLNGAEWIAPPTGAYWLARRPHLPRWPEAEAFVLDHVVGERPVERVLDLGTGDGHMLAIVCSHRPDVAGIGIDISPTLLEAARRRFGPGSGIQLLNHDMARSLSPDWGSFDLVVSALAIHHLSDERKRLLYREIFELLVPGGLFCNVDVVAAPTPALHARAQAVFGYGPHDGHPSDRPALLGDQLEWLTDGGFTNVDCYWKWLKMAVIAGERPVVPDCLQS
jgi:tRNA (cmo5U34)-methyltransferase